MVKYELIIILKFSFSLLFISILCTVIWSEIDIYDNNQAFTLEKVLDPSERLKNRKENKGILIF